MAVDYPLVLFDCHFEGLIWTQEKEEVNYTLSVLQQHWTQSAVRATVLFGMIQDLEEKGIKQCINSSFICITNKLQKMYKLLLLLLRC